jgi:DNA-binding NarL/FixJ family response regulator
MGEASREPIQILICDDHRVLTDTLVSIVEQDPELHLITPPLHTAEEGVEAVRRSHPDVVLMDVEFHGDMNGIEATRQIKEQDPDTVVVIMTAEEDDRLLLAAVEAGASGFLKKTEGVDEFLDAVKAAAAGEVLIDRAALTRLLARVAREREDRVQAQRKLDRLTPRERAVLDLSVQGVRNEEIARQLFISQETVQTHIRNLLRKLGVHSKLEAVAFAIRQGIGSG